ncbi:hypothetical protein [Chryseobacterium sp. SIMBA_038]|uniref:hypothetical protein n=1 Tax=Chryseobacterium sp. SIMBA_038 TaxID=3085780 RepID=UPI00397E01D1
METAFQPQKQLQISEVYIADIVELKNIFLQLSNLEIVTENFGIPFLMIRQKNNIIAFASLFINQKGETDFVIYEKSSLNTEEKKNFFTHAQSYFKRNNSANYRDPLQLKSSIERMINWLNI